MRCRRLNNSLSIVLMLSYSLWTRTPTTKTTLRPPHEAVGAAAAAQSLVPAEEEMMAVVASKIYTSAL